jgi:hypothetical protein
MQNGSAGVHLDELERWLQITECWMCRRPADSECTAKLVMNARADRCLDALGYPVQRGSQLDRVFLEMPRCRSCRDWTTDWVSALAAAAIAGGIAGAIAQAFASPTLLSRVGFGNGGAAIGFIVGFVCTLVAMAWARKLTGRRSANSYPPVVSLHQLGWRLLSD